MINVYPVAEVAPGVFEIDEFDCDDVFVVKGSKRALVMDTAGFNLLEAEEASDPAGLRERYPEFVPCEGKCRFRECLHDREPGCAVREAVQRGEISPERWERYRLLLSEMKEVWRGRYD